MANENIGLPIQAAIDPRLSSITPNDILPSGWFVDQPVPTPDKQPLWMCFAIVSNDEIQDTWSVPIQLEGFAGICGPPGICGAKGFCGS